MIETFHSIKDEPFYCPGRPIRSITVRARLVLFNR